MFPSRWQQHQAAHLIATGGIIACPTEAVFGLSCDPANPQAVMRLLALKNRPQEKGLILVAAGLEQLAPWLQPLTTRQSERLARSWPGPVTWLIPATEDCPLWLRGRHHSLAVRVTGHPLLRRLCDLVGGPLVSTSANRSGQRPARSALEVRLRFGRQIDFILPGPLGERQRPSEIRDLASDRLIRE